MLFVSISFISCVSLEIIYKNNIIEIVYIPGLVDFSVPYNEKELGKINKKKAGDTIIVEANVFKGVILYINSHDNNAHRDSVFDPRFFLKHTDRKCVINNITDNEVDKYSEYKIKCISEYYNYLEEEDMLYDRDVIRYGVPKNYKCLLSDSLPIPSYIKKSFSFEIINQGYMFAPFGTPYSDAQSTINPEFQPFKYNGKEFDIMHGLNTLDYGARQYNPVLPVWDRVDPLAEKYYNVCPYAYCLGNPMRFVDPDGMDVLIWYQDKQGNYHSFLYNGTQRMVPNNSFVLDFVHTYNYLKANNVGENIVRAVKDSSVLLELQKADKTIYQNYDRRHTIFWEPRKGLLLTNGKKQSPAVRLEHEFSHGLDDLENHKKHEERKKLLDEQYSNKEERRVIEGSETKTARKLHQGVRTNHEGNTYPVKDPRFIK